ncbi:leucine-rich repeat domain-containing protein [Vibrio cholerae]|uniref:leucine-rich repeat domain-containing protein n=1 Tax=Vibrio cholerae TaxID=666 RepID=UPI00301D5292
MTNTVHTLTLSDVKYDKKLGEISIYTSGYQNIIIPECFEEFPVNAIGNKAFFSKKITHVIIPDSVTAIGESAFSYNNLTTVTFPNTVSFIGEFAFSNNILTCVNLPKFMIKIHGAAFAINELTHVDIPKETSLLKVTI